MASIRIAGVVAVVGLTTLLIGGVTPAAEVRTVVDRVAGRLQATQKIDAGYVGYWQIGFNGSIVTGMVSAYEYTGNDAYLKAARFGGYSINYDSRNGLFGDDAYALMRLSQHADDPSQNEWRTLLRSFYQALHDRVVEGFTSYDEIDPSTAVFYLAHHAVAAHYVNAVDKDWWRSLVISHLSQVTDAAEYPVMALGVATWALAQTGPLDTTPIGDGAGSTWRAKTLADLPGLLLSHQVPEGQENAGTFYWRFDHQDDGSGAPVSGYTEDAVYAVLGLLAVSDADPGVQIGAYVEAARDALLNAPDDQGDVHVALDGAGISHAALAGELLQVLPELDPVWVGNRSVTGVQFADDNN